MTIKNKRVLVTGAGGFIGQHLCKALFEKEATVVGFVRSAVDNKYLSEQYDVDISDEMAISEIINSVQPEFVVHLAASKNRGVDAAAYKEGYKTNIMGSLNIINACQDIPVFFSRCIFIFPYIFCSCSKNLVTSFGSTCDTFRSSTCHTTVI